MQHGSNGTQALTQAQGLIYGNLIRQSTMLAFVDDFWLMGVTFLALIPLMFLMKKAKPHAAGPVADH
jgi:DHA2 family multidrug resistance protein